MTQNRVLVTGAAGKVGKVVVQDLLSHGYDVFAVDRDFKEDPGVPHMTAELTNFGEALDALSSTGVDVYGRAEMNAFDAIVHLASIPHPREVNDADTFSNNMVATYNVFESAKRLGINNIVWSSSETLLGIPFEQSEIEIVPVTEDVKKYGSSTYAITKVLGEELAEQFCLHNPDMKIACLRLSNVMEDEDYKQFPDYQKNPNKRLWNLWSYIDVRDAAQSIRKAIETEFKGMDTFIITNDDTVMDTSSEELVKEYYPNMKINGELTENQTLLSNEKAKRILGYQPKHSWRDFV